MPKLDSAPPPEPLASRPDPAARRDAGEALDEGDIRLIRWMLELTPTQRLEALEGFVNSIEALRHGRRTPTP